MKGGKELSRQRLTKEQAVERFWSKVDKTDDCWNWTGAKTKFGHGMVFTGKNFSDNGSMLAHRFSYLLSHGEFDKNLNVCHKCDNPACVRPDHLFLGTYSDNNQDMANKGRHYMQTNPRNKGENNNTTKLTWEQVREIRKLYSKGGISQRELGRRYKVDNKTIQAIVQKRTWKE